MSLSDATTAAGADAAGVGNDVPPSADDIGGVVAAARAAFDRGETRPLEWRHRQLEGLLRVLDEGEDDLVRALAADLGKPRLEGWAADLGVTAGEIRVLDKHLDRWAAPRKVRVGLTSRPGSGAIHPEPLGVALVIAPWNYPVQLLVGPMAAALAAGNAVVAKPSELAPATSEALARLCARHLDSDAVSVVEGGVDAANALLAERFDHILFTGSTKVGRIVMEAAARHLTPVTLELGGKSPAIVHASANIDVTARRLAWGKFLNAGQTCTAPDYVLVEAPVRDRLLDGLAASISEFYGDRPIESDSYARIVSHAHVRRLQGLLEAEGAGTVAVGGDVVAAERFIAPTVLVGSDPASPIMQEEIFGPLLPVLTVDSLDEAIRFVNGRPKPLALYVFSGDRAGADQVLAETSSGGAMVNHVNLHVTEPALPFGGVGPSGMGRYHARASFDTFSNLKSVLRKPFRPDPALLYPPFGRLKEKVIRRVF